MRAATLSTLMVLLGACATPVDGVYVVDAVEGDCETLPFVGTDVFVHTACEPGSCQAGIEPFLSVFVLYDGTPSDCGLPDASGGFSCSYESFGEGGGREYHTMVGQLDPPNLGLDYAVRLQDRDDFSGPGTTCGWSLDATWDADERRSFGIILPGTF